jgi:diguanylate cyclase (GGDEF)-like protein
MRRTHSSTSAKRSPADNGVLRLIAPHGPPADDSEQLTHVVGELQALRDAMARVEQELADTRVREAEARRLAMHDELTGLPHKRYFRQRLERALAPGGPSTEVLAVLYIDLNGFKDINDSHGHAIGDRVLQIMADRLSHSMRAEDMVCRLGGDEFACLLCDIPDRRRISRVATKICAVLGAPVLLGNLRLSLSAAIGIALSPADGSAVEILMDHADEAMYRAKRCLTRYTFYREDAAAAVLSQPA